MSEIPITRMGPKEYIRVFSRAPYEIDTGEVVVDVGSGDSDLSSVVSDGMVVQIDPLYHSFPDAVLHREQGTTQVAMLPAALGTRTSLLKSVVNQMAILRPTRVTTANTLKYLKRTEQLVFLEQMLAMAHSGMVQVHPFPHTYSEAISMAADDMGVPMQVQRVGLTGLRQLANWHRGINATLTIDNRDQQIGPEFHGRLATLIADCLPPTR